MIAATGFLVSQFGPLFRWPEWALDISVFRLYGTPLTAGVYATGLYVEVAVLVIGFGLALVTMRFRDVGD